VDSYSYSISVGVKATTRHGRHWNRQYQKAPNPSGNPDMNTVETIAYHRGHKYHNIKWMDVPSIQNTVLHSFSIRIHIHAYILIYIGPKSSNESEYSRYTSILFTNLLQPRIQFKTELSTEILTSYHTVFH